MLKIVEARIPTLIPPTRKMMVNPPFLEGSISEISALISTLIGYIAVLKRAVVVYAWVCLKIGHPKIGIMFRV